MPEIYRNLWRECHIPRWIVVGLGLATPHGWRIDLWTTVEQFRGECFEVAITTDYRRIMAQDLAHAALAEWGPFYVITGSAAAALTGLQFVVMALVAETRSRSSSSTIGAFSTPTIVHFCAVLLISATLSAPWRMLSSVAYLLGACGIAGVVYAGLVTRRTRRQVGYQPVLEDWVWHAALPVVAYTMLLISALVLLSHEATAMFAIGTAVLLLLFIGIHNAWDTVTYIVVEKLPDRKE